MLCPNLPLGGHWPQFEPRNCNLSELINDAMILSSFPGGFFQCRHMRIAIIVDTYLGRYLPTYVLQGQAGYEQPGMNGQVGTFSTICSTTYLPR
jgi:hypothetical protein